MPGVPTYPRSPIIKTRTLDSLHWGMLFALLLVTALAVDQRNNLKRKDARIQELCDLCHVLTLENVDLKQAAKEPKE